MTRIVTGWPAGIRESVSHNNEPALADIPAVLGADGAALYGYVGGTDTVATNTPNPVAPSPSGQLGHDHSGGRWGRPLFRTIATWAGNDRQPTGTGQPMGGGNLSDSTGPTFVGAGASPDMGPSEAERYYVQGGWNIWVPPGDATLDAAYGYLGCIAKFWTFRGNLNAGDTVDFRIKNLHPDATNSVTWSLSTTIPTNQTIESNSDERLRVMPGQINILELSILITTDATVGLSRGCDIRLIAIELGVHGDVTS